jgi:hypothetical protein
LCAGDGFSETKRAHFPRWSLSALFRDLCFGGRAESGEVDLGVESKKMALPSPIHRQVVGPSQVLCGEVSGLPSNADRVDDVGRRESERQEMSQISRMPLVSDR